MSITSVINMVSPASCAESDAAVCRVGVSLTGQPGNQDPGNQIRCADALAEAEGAMLPLVVDENQLHRTHVAISREKAGSRLFVRARWVGLGLDWFLPAVIRGPRAARLTWGFT